MPDLLDASVWLPLSAPDHPHHQSALNYWNTEAAAELAFCRVTSLALLRHLTNPRILGNSALDGQGAWEALQQWLSVPGVIRLPEPDGIDGWLEVWNQRADIRRGHWTDAYLAAFAVAAGCRLVAFDSDFHRYTGINFLHLSCQGSA